jgi:uncharacterized membrane protein/predicted DsbA family dithiol-disulfide isomerase
MPRPRSLLLLRLASLVALGVSMALLIDSLRPQPAFCSTGAGCDQIRRLGYGKIAGVPVPALGLAAYGSLLGLSFFPTLRRFTAQAALFGGVVGLGLLASQLFVLHILCKFCVVVDLSAVVAALAGFWLLRSGEPHHDPGRIAWAGAHLAALAGPWALVALQPPNPVPRTIQALWKPGQVTVVEFSDFECPFCRMAHPALEAALHKASDLPILFVRKTMPLPSHPNARTASRAYLCAEAAGKGPAMADRLFSGSLSRIAASVNATELGIPSETFDRCMEDLATDRKVDEHVDFVRNSSFQGLPSVWVNDQLLLGGRSEADYLAAFRKAASGRPAEQGAWWPLALVAALSLGLIGAGVLGARKNAA